MRSWDKYLQQEVEKYFAHDILMNLLTFVTYPSPLWDWIHVWPLLGVPLSETNEKEAFDIHLLQDPSGKTYP
ncbi:hypothetical protein B0H34DRAFT_706061 [Crassisporium funariophilum]|nr:hypothetical protein B0H34DRAFT_706061 [Crassisporium funariophilum]